MNCSNIINLGCISSCDRLILIENFEGFLPFLPTRIKYKTTFNGAVIEGYQLISDFDGNIYFDISGLNEDYGYIINIEIQSINIGDVYDAGCFNFTINPKIII